MPAGQIIKRSERTWLVRIYLGVDAQTGKRKYFNKTVHGTKKNAESYLASALHDRDLGTFAAPLKTTMSELFDDIKRDYRINGKRLDWCTIVVEKHLRPFFGGLRAVKLTSDVLERYIDQRQDMDVSNGTINRELTILRRSLNLGVHAEPPKVIKPPKIPKLTENPPRKGFFEHHEFLALRSELPEHLRAPLTFAYYTGCRKGEILLLRLEQIDWVERLVRLNPGETKNREGRIIPLLGELYDMLVMQKQTRDQHYPECPWAFFNDEGKPIGKDFRGSWDSACKRAATRADNPAKSLWDTKAKRPAKLFHDLRRTGARNLVRAGVPERVVMDIGGWKTRSVFDRYNIVDERDLKAAGEKLARYLAEKAQSSHTIRTQEAPGKARRASKNIHKLLN